MPQSESQINTFELSLEQELRENLPMEGGDTCPCDNGLKRDLLHFGQLSSYFLLSRQEVKRYISRHTDSKKKKKKTELFQPSPPLSKMQRKSLDFR